MFITSQPISPKGTLNAADIRKVLEYTRNLFAAPVLVYLLQLSGTLNINHALFSYDFIPNILTVGAIEGWGLGILINLFAKSQNPN